MATALLTTGGTILSAPGSDGSPQPTLPVSSLLAEIERDGTQLFDRMEEVSRVDSADMTPALMLEVAAHVARLTSDSNISGVVVLHGSDTLEETAFLCDLVLDTDKPVVFTAAMRPTGEVGADGPRNLWAAWRAARDVRLCGLGVTVVANEEIHAARWLRKMDSVRPSAFRSPGHGPIGIVAPSGVRLEMVPTGRPQLAAPNRDLPTVPIVQVYTGISPKMLIGVADLCGARGVVLEGFGMGNIPGRLVGAVRDILKLGVTVVVTARTPEGGTHAVYGGGGAAALVAQGALEGGSLSAAKARLLLMLLLARDEGEPARAMFRDVIAELHGHGHHTVPTKGAARSQFERATPVQSS